MRKHMFIRDRVGGFRESAKLFAKPLAKAHALLKGGS
jgi:hypothetical protein